MTIVVETKRLLLDRGTAGIDSVPNNDGITYLNKPHSVMMGICFTYDIIAKVDDPTH